MAIAYSGGQLRIDGGSYTPQDIRDADVTNGWGITSYDKNGLVVTVNTQFGVYFGNSAAADFTIKDEAITWQRSGGGQLLVLFGRRTQCRLYMGEENNGTPDSGGLMFLNNAHWNSHSGSSNSELHIYNSRIYQTGSNSRNFQTTFGTCNIKDTTFDGFASFYNYSDDLNYEDMVIRDAQALYGMNTSPGEGSGTGTGLKLYNNKWGLFFGNAVNDEIIGADFNGSTTADVRVTEFSTKTLDLTDCIFDDDITPSIEYYQNSGATVRTNYRWKCKVYDGVNPVTSGTFKAWDASQDPDTDTPTVDLTLNATGEIVNTKFVKETFQESTATIDAEPYFFEVTANSKTMNGYIRPSLKAGAGECFDFVNLDSIGGGGGTETSFVF